MARTARKVHELVEEGEDMEDALRTVHSVAEANGGAVAWEDVDDDLTSGQWGRIIETGLLESADGDGFELNDPDGVDAALNGDADAEVVDLDFSDIPEIDEEAEEAASWSQWDKLAAVGAVMMMVGYYFDPVQNAVGGALDLALGPLLNVLPFYLVIFSVALLTGLYSSLLMANLMDQETMSVYQDRMSAIQDKRKEAKDRGDDEAVERIQEKQMEMMGDQLGMMKSQFRPMVWVMLLTIPVFLWLWWTIDQGGVGVENGPDMYMPLVGGIDWNDGVIGPMRAWIIWYIGCSFGFGQILRKTLNIRASPS
ncbi:EMC3/TMCO1 family protein [Salinarchaeum chitinilyticum]